MDNLLEMNINIACADDIRIRLNGKDYRLIPVEDNTPAEDNNIPSLTQHVAMLTKRLNTFQQQRTAETYRCATNSFLRFLGQDDISLTSIDASLIDNYERHLKARHLAINTRSFYMRVLRTIYNRAVADYHIHDQRPFTQVYTGFAKTRKRAITLAEIQQLSQLQNLTPPESLARDLFLFSLYTRGMAFVDMAYLKPSNLSNGILTYRRRKTGQQLAIRWEQQMQDIVDRHPSHNADYLLPIIKRSNGSERWQYREGQRLVNVMLKPVGQKAGIQQPLTMYVARHSWASIARSLDIPVNIISEGMGHHTERTTHIYLSALDANRIDTMNATIIQAVSNPTAKP